MNFENIQQFFTDNINSFLPYSGHRIYELLINFIKDVYLKNIYQKIPTDLKKMFEDLEIPISVFDNILTGIGLPDNIIENLSIENKLIFINSIQNFQRYKSSVKFFKNVGFHFGNNLNIYELYIGEDDNGWVLKPVLIYKGLDRDHPLDTFSYYEIYNKIPSLLISVDQLVNLKHKGDTLFPIKSNIVFLDFEDKNEANQLTNIILTSFLKDYGDEIISFYLGNQIYDVSLKVLYRLIFLINLVRSVNDKVSFPLYKLIGSRKSLYEISILVDEFLTLDNSYDIGIFVSDNFNQEFVHFQDVLISISDILPSTLSIEVDKFLKSTKTRLELLRYIYGSLILFRSRINDTIFSKHFDIFLESVPIISDDPSLLTIYNILHTLKPFHTEFLSSIQSELIFNENTAFKITYDVEIEMERSLFMSEVDYLLEYDLLITSNIDASFKINHGE